jgi:hypothetical protein
MAQFIGAVARNDSTGSTQNPHQLAYVLTQLGVDASVLEAQLQQSIRAALVALMPRC